MAKHHRRNYVVSGLLVVMAALWGGAYALSLLNIQDWQVMPTLFTSMWVFIGGVALMIFGGISK